MKKMLVLFVMAAFLAVGCGGEKKDEAKKEEAKKEEGKKDEGKKDEGKKDEGEKDEGEKDEAKPAGDKDEGKAEAKPEEAAAEGGEALWTKSCEHAAQLILGSSDMAKIPDEAKADMLKNIPLECFAELKRHGGAAADESAKCMLGLTEFSPEGFGGCEPKGDAPKAMDAGEKPEVEEKK